MSVAGRRLDADEVEAIRRMRSDGYTISTVAETLGHNERTVWRYAPGRPGKVPVAPLREAFLASPLTATDVARSLGWWENRGWPDGARVKRALGLLPDISGTTHRRTYRNLTDAETVQLIAEAIGVAPWSVMPDE